MPRRFNKYFKRYMQSWFPRLVPNCGKNLLKKPNKDRYVNENDGLKCSGFLPAFTNHGLCLTRNGINPDKIFNSIPYLNAFQSSFLFGNEKYEVKNMSSDLSDRRYSFVIDGNRYKDLKRGIEWNSMPHATMKLNIHNPHDIADIRGWRGDVINVPMGKITTVRISFAQLQSEQSVRDVDIEKRDCRFKEENDDMSSIDRYSKINCLFDCTMEFAEKRCGCRPWDYPTSNEKSKQNTSKNQLRICDFFGSSCYNNVLQGTSTSECQGKCISDCNEIKYSMSINFLPLDSDNGICGLIDNSNTNWELNIKSHLTSLFSDKKVHDSDASNLDGPPERWTMKLIKDALQTNVSSNEAYYIDETRAFQKDCKAKLQSDIAVVHVIIGSPTFTRMVKSVKVSTSEKVAIFGNFRFQNYIITNVIFIIPQIHYNYIYL